MIYADVLTDKVAVVLQNRPVVSLASWMTRRKTGQALQVVTSIESRLSTPLKLVLNGGDSRWVVSHDGGYYDGLSGVPLIWDGARFVQSPTARDFAPGFLIQSQEQTGAQLTVNFKVRHGNDPGGAVEQFCHALTGLPPTGFGSAEPVTTRWDRKRLGPGTYAVVGQGGAIASVAITSAGGGHEETVTLVAGYPDPQQAPIASIPSIVAAVSANNQIVSLLAQVGPGRADLTAEAHRAAMTVPIGIALSGQHAVQGFTSHPVGAATWFPLNEGPDGWQRYQALRRGL